MQLQLDQKVAIITGSDSGIGRAVSVADDEEWARFVVALGSPDGAAGPPIPLRPVPRRNTPLAPRPDPTRPAPRYWLTTEAPPASQTSSPAAASLACASAASKRK